MNTTAIDDSSRGIPEMVADDGHRIEFRHWPAAHGTRGVVQLLHGLAEHIGRYERFAGACSQRGLAVVAHNHRGHGQGFAPDRLGHFGDSDGWNRVVDDVRLVQMKIRERYPHVPLILMGHSMGSYIAQCFLMRGSDAVDALVLSGSTWPNRGQVKVGRLLARVLGWLRGPAGVSPLFDRMSFAQFNKRFAPNRTDFDWLSRDQAEVDLYVADPLCGAPSTNALWRDLFAALLEISAPGAVASVPSSLPILITGGESDPVGGAEALTLLAAEYEASGHDKLVLKLYADGRHEMLNETNRDEVTDDILSWIDRVIERP